MAVNSSNVPPIIFTDAGDVSPTGSISPTSLQRARSASHESQSAASKVASVDTSIDGEGRPAVGSLLRLKPLTIHDLPTPPGWTKENNDVGPPANSAYWLGDKSVEHPSLVEFVQDMLLEGHRFIKDPEHFRSLGTTASKPATAKVEKTHRLVTEAELKDVDWAESICTNRRGFKPVKEDWFGRRSTHETRLLDGTASWSEFVEGLLRDHSENEAEYDPSVYDCRCIIDWKPHIQRDSAEFDARFSEVSMRGWFPIFLVAVLSCESAGEYSMLTASQSWKCATRYRWASRDSSRRSSSPAGLTPTAF
jgi:hypothetical protein